MTSVLAVYVGESMKANLEVAIERGVWGCPVPQQMQLRAGDFVMFGGGVPGGPRQTGNRPTAADGSELDVDRSWFSRSAGSEPETLGGTRQTVGQTLLRPQDDPLRPSHLRPGASRDGTGSVVGRDPRADHQRTARPQRRIGGSLS